MFYGKHNFFNDSTFNVKTMIDQRNFPIKKPKPEKSSCIVKHKFITLTFLCNFCHFFTVLFVESF